MTDYIEYGYEHSRPSQIIGYVLDPILKQLAGIKDPVILDLGCGNGWFVRELVERGFDAYGLDASREGVEIANGQMPARYFVQDLTSNQLPPELGGKQFDVVLSTEVIEHLYNPRKFLDLVANILRSQGKSGGKLLLTCPYHGYWKYLVLAITGKMDRHLDALRVGGHIKFFSRNTMEQLLDEQGFVMQHFEGCGRFPLLWKSMFVCAELKN